MAFEILAYVIIAVILGRWVETKVDINGLGVGLFIFIFTGLWVYRVIVTLNEIDNDAKK